MKKKFSILALCISIFIINVNAQLFWKVSGNGLTKPSYLFGTHHLIEKEKIPGFDKITAFVPLVDIVVGEMKMTNMLSMQLKMLKACVMKDSTMHQLLTPEEYTLVDANLKEVLGKGLDKLGRMKPAMLTSMYELMLYMKQSNSKKQPEAVDVFIQNEGKKSKKMILGLETIDQQINILLNSSPLKYQAEGLVEITKNKEKSLKVLDDMNTAYLKGDLDGLVKLMNDDEKMSEQEKNVLLTNRNANWIGQLLKLMPQKSCFVAVGCMHLANNTGLIQLLRNAGFTVEPVVL